MGLKINRNDDDKIVSIKTNDGVFSYSFLVEPRPASDFQAGSYGTQFIIRDKETLAAIKEYLNQVMVEGKDSEWEGKIPKTLSIPLKAGDKDSELTKGAYVLKTSTKHAPKVLIRNESGRAHEITEDEHGEIYSGMIGELIFTLRAYNYLGKKGITAYINAACKTAAGTPLGNRGNYEDDFSLENEFDENDFDEKEKQPKGTDKAGSKKTGKKEEEAEVDVDSLINSDGGSEESDGSDDDVNVDEMSIEDFM